MIWRVSSATLPRLRARRFEVITAGMLTYALTSAVVLLGVSFGHQFVSPPPGHSRRSFWDGFSAHDGGWYKQIATCGYSYDPEKRSPVAFFPLYPLLVAVVIRLTGLAPTCALMIVSHGCLAAAFVAAAAYIHGRRPASDRTTASFALLALGLMPATLFFRMAYSESSFLLVSLLFLLGIQRSWPLIVVALVAGLASSSRPVGVGLLAPLVIYAWRRSPGFLSFTTRVFIAVPVGCWGLIAYAVFLYARHGDALAFAKTQDHWGSPAPAFASKVVSLFTYEPIWEVFLTGPTSGWSLFNWELVNPAYYVIAIFIIVLGAYCGWLNLYETSLAGALLAIPYVTRAYEMEMASQARFSAVVFPVYLVLGHLLQRLPVPIACAILGVSAYYLGASSGLFASGHSVF